jgi:hypothetical protein
MGGPTLRHVAAIYATALLFAAVAAWAADTNTAALKRPTSLDQAKLFIARQQIDAEISTIDQSRNGLTLKTNAGKFRLEAAPAVPAYFKTGDRVVLEVGILASAWPRRSSRNSGAKRSGSSQSSRSSAKSRPQFTSAGPGRT